MSITALTATVMSDPSDPIADALDRLTPEQIARLIADFSTRRTVNLASARFGLGTVSQVNYGFLVTILKQLQESEECTRQLEKLHERNKKEIQRLQAALKKYGRHLFHCVGEHSDSPDISLCTCGLKDGVVRVHSSQECKERIS